MRSAEVIQRLQKVSFDKTDAEAVQVALALQSADPAANYAGWDCYNEVTRTEYEIVEDFTKDVLEKLNRTNVSDLDRQITKMEQLAELQRQFYESISTFENMLNRDATIQRVTELKMERSIRMLRLTPDMLSYMENSNDNNKSVFENMF
ncbi:hypothetical protein JHK86_002990 [Glycine max]|nr:hypothetical protein JHK86_002990 [Glycine max]